jgi:hypothetical protein
MISLRCTTSKWHMLLLPEKAGVTQRGFGYASIPNSVGAFMVEGWLPTISRQIANMSKPASRSCEGGRREVATLKRGACARALTRDSYPYRPALAPPRCSWCFLIRSSRPFLHNNTKQNHCLPHCEIICHILATCRHVLLNLFPISRAHSPHIFPRKCFIPPRCLNSHHLHVPAFLHSII